MLKAVVVKSNWYPPPILSEMEFNLLNHCDNSCDDIFYVLTVCFTNHLVIFMKLNHATKETLNCLQVSKEERSRETDSRSTAKTGVILPYVNNKTSSQLTIGKEARKFSLKWIACLKQWLQQQAKTMQRVLYWHLFNNYSSSPNGFWVNRPRGRRPNGLFMAIDSWAMWARGIILTVKSN